jgi:hypothetical protein
MLTLNDAMVRIIENPANSMWLGNASAFREPDVVRTMGARVEPDRRHVVVYVPESGGADLIRNLAGNPRITLLTAVINTYESYQFKGDYAGHWACSAEEVEYQRTYLEGFAASSMQFYGLPKEKIIVAYFRQPAVSIRMRIEEGYEQTPRKGTGQRIFAQA